MSRTQDSDPEDRDPVAQPDPAFIFTPNDEVLVDQPRIPPAVPDLKNDLTLTNKEASVLPPPNTEEDLVRLYGTEPDPPPDNEAKQS